MDRDEFMELVYETFADEPDNVLANGIIEAADAYVEHEKAQLSQEGTTSDTISRQAALDIFDDYNISVENGELEAYSRDRKRLCELQSVQPVATDINIGDKISKFIDGLEEIFADLRERHVDDSVCGLCEYDGAYIGQSGDWCNECPGFERDDCFKLSDKTRKKWTDEIIKALPTIQTETPCYLGSPCEYQNPDVVISQPEPAIPVAWIDKHIEWLKSLDNEFANLAAAHISVMLKKWRSEQNETD